MIEIHASQADMSARAAGLIIETAAQSIRDRGRALITLSGGSSPTGTYELLGSDQHHTSVDWSRVHFFWSDERCVPITERDNNFGSAWSLFLEKLDIPSGNIHRIESELEPAEAALKYQRVLSDYADPPLHWPRFDLILLGLGEDGHTASIFPNSPMEVTSPTLPVTIHYQDRPAKRITLTPLVINSARNILFLAAGRNKSEAIFNAMEGERNPGLYPAQRIHPDAGRVIWLLDQNAAALLIKQRR